MATKAIVHQLTAFGYNEDEIQKAIDSVANKQDINVIREYIDSNANKSIQESVPAATYFDTSKDLNPSRYNKLCVRGNQKWIDLVNGYIRKFQSQCMFVVPTGINQYICLFYIDDMRRLTWNNQYYARSRLFLEDNMTLCRHETSSGYAHVSADIEPISEGKHCFRVLAHSQSRNTLFFSFMKYDESQKEKYNSFYGAQLYGTTTHGYTVSNGSNKNDGLYNPAVEYQLDLLIDCEKKYIKIGFIKEWPNAKRYEIIHENIPDWEWIPHFNLYDGSSSIRIIRINPSLYRRHNVEADKLLCVDKKE